MKRHTFVTLIFTLLTLNLFSQNNWSDKYIDENWSADKLVSLIDAVNF